jgi:hypothetical protein
MVLMNSWPGPLLRYFSRRLASTRVRHVSQYSNSSGRRWRVEGTFPCSCRFNREGRSSVMPMYNFKSFNERKTYTVNIVRPKSQTLFRGKPDPVERDKLDFESSLPRRSRGASTNSATSAMSCCLQFRRLLSKARNEIKQYPEPLWNNSGSVFAGPLVLLCTHQDSNLEPTD